MKKVLVLLIILLVTPFLFSAGQEEAAWNGPQSPVTMLVQYSAGGSTDLTARIICKNAEQYIGQSIAVVNQNSGGGVVAHRQVVTAKPDGLTFLLANPPNMLTDYLTKEGVNYTLEDFKPIIMFAADPILLITKAGSALDKPIPDFVNLVRANPKKYKIGNPGQWGINDFGRVTIEKACQIEFERIPYAGGADAVVALLGGEVDVITTFYGDARQHIQQGTFKVIGVADAKRLRFLPDVPTFKEKGFDAQVTSWRVVVGPKDLPQEMVTFYHNAFKQSMDAKETQNQLEQLGINMAYMGSAEALNFLKQEKANYEAIVKQFNLAVK